MNSGTLYEQGEIVLVPFPFSDLSGTKKRPVLILSKEKYNQNTIDIITCGITSNLKNTPSSVCITEESLCEGRIGKESRIKVDKLFTIEQTMVLKSLGKINPATLAQVKKEFVEIM